MTVDTMRTLPLAEVEARAEKQAMQLLRAHTPASLPQSSQFLHVGRMVSHPVPVPQMEPHSFRYACWLKGEGRTL